MDHANPHAVRQLVAFALLLVLAACQAAEPGGTQYAPSGSAPIGGLPSAPTAVDEIDCSAPWGSSEQSGAGPTQVHTMSDVAWCASLWGRYDVVPPDDGDEITIVVESRELEIVAASLADAFLRYEFNAEQIVVRAYSDGALVATAFDRVVLSEQGERTELLVFEICTGWTDGGDGTELCDYTMNFSVPQE